MGRNAINMNNNNCRYMRFHCLQDPIKFVNSILGLNQF